MIRDSMPILPLTQKDAEKTNKADGSPPPSPCKEVVVVNGFGFQLPPPTTANSGVHPAFKVAVEYKKWKGQQKYLPQSAAYLQQ